MLQSAAGRVRLHVAYPVNHAGEADRWDMRVTETFRDANVPVFLEDMKDWDAPAPEA